MRLSAISDEIRDDLAEALHVLKAEGFRYVDISGIRGKTVDVFTQEEIEGVKRTVAENGFQVSNIAAFGFMFAKLYEDYELGDIGRWGTNFVGSPKEQLHHLYFLCSAARQLGAESIRLFPFRYPENRTVVGTKEDRDKIVQYMKQAAAIAKAEGVRLLLENCPYTHCPKGLMTKDIVKRVDSQWLKMLWDPANSYRADKHRVPAEFLQSQTTLEDELRECLPYIGHIHVKNYRFNPQREGKQFQHVALGEGDIDFESLAAILKEEAYDGPVSIEPEVETAEEILDSLRYFREVFRSN